VLLFLLLLQAVSSASAAKIEDQPPDKVSIAYDVKYTFRWKTSEPFKAADLQMFYLDRGSHSECSIAEYKSSSSDTLLTESRGSDLSISSDMKSANISVSTLTYGVKPDGNEFGGAFNQSSTTQYICYVFKFTATFSSGNDHSLTLVKLYKSSSEIPAAEKLPASTGYTLKWWVWIIGGGIAAIVIILMIIYPADM